jgi:hypothetical protein
VVTASTEVVIRRPAIGTLVRHPASVLPAAQLLPRVVDVSVWSRRWSPVSCGRLLTVTEYVMVTVDPTVSGPFQDRFEPLRTTVPVVATAPPA